MEPPFLAEQIRNAVANFVMPRTARLLHNATICARLQELRNAITASFLQLAIIERDQRLIALQERWDGLRQAERFLRSAITPRR
jgi:hypothetical protein